MLFVTERAVFRGGPDGLVLTELAPGADLERDVLAQMAFRPLMAEPIVAMDARLFLPGHVGMDEMLAARPPITRSPRLAELA